MIYVKTITPYLKKLSKITGVPVTSSKDEFLTSRAKILYPLSYFFIDKKFREGRSVFNSGNSVHLLTDKIKLNKFLQRTGYISQNYITTEAGALDILSEPNRTKYCVVAENKNGKRVYLQTKEEFLDFVKNNHGYSFYSYNKNSLKYDIHFYNGCIISMKLINNDNTSKFLKEEDINLELVKVLQYIHLLFQQIGIIGGRIILSKPNDKKYIQVESINMIPELSSRKVLSNFSEYLKYLYSRGKNFSWFSLSGPYFFKTIIEKEKERERMRKEDKAEKSNIPPRYAMWYHGDIDPIDDTLARKVPANEDPQPVNTVPGTQPENITTITTGEQAYTFVISDLEKAMRQRWEENTKARMKNLERHLRKDF